jgi:hypothetical protein
VSCNARPSKPVHAPVGASDGASEPRTLPPPRSQPDR